MTPLATPPATGLTRTPAEAAPALLLVTVVFDTNSLLLAVGAKWIPFPGEPRKPRSTQFSTCSAAPLLKRIPSTPAPTPAKSNPRKTTVSAAPAETTNPLVPPTKTPASIDSHATEIALVMGKAPKPPGSRQLISPLAAVFEIAPAKVLHGAVRLQGFASSPTPETHVRVACARAGELRT